MSEETNNEYTVGRVAPDDVDEELMALAQNEPPSILRPILMIGVILMAAWVVSDWRSELEYLFSSSNPIDLGDVTEFASMASDDPNFEPDIPHNRFVELRGIPSRRSQSTRYRYAKMVGSWVFVEIERDDYISDPIERELQGEAKTDVDRTYFEGRGRALAFSEMPDRYRGLRHYYSSRYTIRFCEEFTPRELREYEQQRREALVEELRAEYKEATPEQRIERGLSETPDPQEVQGILDRNPSCVKAYLIQVDTEPRDHYLYGLAALAFLGFMLFNVVMLIRWFRAFMRQ